MFSNLQRGHCIAARELSIARTIQQFLLIDSFRPIFILIAWKALRSIDVDHMHTRHRISHQGAKTDLPPFAETLMTRLVACAPGKKIGIW